MTGWKDGVDQSLFRVAYGPNDKIVLLENVSAISPKGGRMILEKGQSFQASMKGGFLFCRLGGNKYNEAAILPADFSKVQIVR